MTAKAVDESTIFVYAPSSLVTISSYRTVSLQQKMQAIQGPALFDKQGARACYRITLLG
jgi:hypothetical protein